MTTVFQATLLGGFDEFTNVIEESHSSLPLLFNYESEAVIFPKTYEKFYTTQFHIPKDAY